MLDLTDSIQPKSDQMNADDLLSGPRTFTITDVRKTGSEDQPFAITLAEFPPGRPFKPSKSMRRVMVFGWGKDGAQYVGKRFTLYRDPKVTWAGQEIGGIRISHMSHLRGGKRLTLALTMNQKQRAPYVVEPLADDAPVAPTLDEETVKRIEDLRGEWMAADDTRRAEIEAEVAKLEEGKS